MKVAKRQKVKKEKRKTKKSKYEALVNGISFPGHIMYA